MTSPFELPRHSGYSHSLYSRATQKPVRAPIHNPYDKFTQPEFDAWIGGITGALRRALGHEDEVEIQPKSRLFHDDAFSSDDEEIQRLIEGEDGSVDAEFDDSVAEYTTRRAGKGKARDPRDGPGFGKGDKNEPIVIGSEEEEEGEAEGEGQIEDVEEDEGGLGEWEEGSQSEEEVEEFWGKGETSAQARVRHEKRRLNVEEEEKEEECDEDEGQTSQEDENEYNALSSKKASSPVLVLSSDEEQGEGEDEASSADDLDEEYSGEEYSDKDHEAGTSMLIRKSYPATTHPPRRRASSPVAEDLRDVDEIEEDDHDVQLLDNVTPFSSPTVALHVSAIENHVETCDSWSSVNTYAEDTPSGGSIHARPNDLTADHFGPGDEGETPTKRATYPVENDVIDVDDVDDRNPEEVQPVFEDTSFPPHDAIDELIPSDRPIEIPDRWEGLKTYAEDYYSGGDIPSQADPVNAHCLGASDEIITLTPDTSKSLVESEDRSGAEAVEISDHVQQSIAEKSTFLPILVPPSVSQTDYSIELAVSRDGLADHAEDYDAGSDIRQGLVDALSTDHLRVGDDADAPIIIKSIDDFEDHTAETKTVPPDAIPESRVIFEHAGDRQGDSQEVTDTHGGVAEVDENIARATSSTICSPIHPMTFQTTDLELGGLYDDMAAAAFGDSGDIQHQPVDLSHIDWDYASALLNGSTSTMDQLTAPEAAFDGVTVGNQADSQEEVTEITEDPPRDVEGAERVPTTLEPSVENVNDAIEEAVASVEVPAAPVEGAVVLDAHSDAPSLDQPQTSSTLSTPFHHHVFGLPTPPSERTNDIDLPVTSEQEDIFGASKETDSDIMILELDVPLVKNVDTINADVSITLEAEGSRAGGKAEHDAHAEVIFDADAVREIPSHVQTEEGYTQETNVVDSSLDEALDGRATSLVDGLPDGTTMQSDVRAQAFSKPAESPEPDLNTSTTGITRLEETIAANGDAAVTSSSDVHVFSSRNGISMPVIANPAVPDPTSRPHTPISHSPIFPLPENPSFTLSPTGTPGTGRPTPVSVPLPTSVLKALRMQQSQPGGSSNGLFTPDPAVDSGPASPGPTMTQTEIFAEPEAAERSARSSLDHAAIDGRPAETYLDSRTVLATTQEAQNSPRGVTEATTTENALALAEQTQRRELELSSYTLRPPILQRAPSGPYSLRVVMRKAADPVLFSDPYPASLSTPENVVTYLVKDIQDEECENFSQDNSISSVSTVDKESEHKVDDAILDDPRCDEDMHTDNMELRYPSSQPDAQGAVSTVIVLEESLQGVDDLHEADADGDLDPDFVETANKPRERTPPPVPRQEGADDANIYEPPSNITPMAKAQENDKGKPESAQAQDSYTPIVERAGGAPLMPVMLASSSKSDDELPSILIIKKPAIVGGRRKDVDDGFDVLTDLEEPPRSPAKPRTGRSTKRKRSSSIQATSPLTRSMSSKQPEKRKVSSRAAVKPRGSDVKKTSNKASLGKDRGKGREIHEPPAHTSSFDTRSITSRSSSDASSALRMLYPSSQNTSRASSVVSNATSDNSLITVHPSPTLHKSSSFRHQAPPPPPPPPPPPLLHRHHRPQPTQSQPSRPPVTQKASLSSRQTDPPSNEAVANKPSTSSQPATSHRGPIYSSSPVTRSNCRYHKISIPKSEDGPRVFFLVPGCSLGNRELIEEEEILDHGDALPEDGRRMTQDLDAYDFDPCLISTLRLLVGVDMLREQEVYYLPQLGPDLVPLRRRNEGDDKATWAKASSRDLTSAADHAGVSPRRNSAASANSPPSSMAGSTSTSASAVRSVGRSDMKPSSVISYSESEFTEEEESPKAKRARPSPVEARSAIGNMGPPDTQPERSLRSKGSKQGIKRSRTSDVAREPDMDTQKSKKQKTDSIDLRGMT